MTDPRPHPLSHENIAEKVAEVRETDDVYRVYRPEWVIAFASTVPAEGTALEVCQRHFAEHYEGRIRPEDVHYVEVGWGPHAVYRLMLRLPTLKGEWKYAFLAHRWAEEQGWADYQIVARNSKDDHELRSYGVRKLPT